MPIQTNALNHRFVQIDFRLPGSVEQAWGAVCTGAGMSAWFTPVELDEQVGGGIRFDLGGGMTTSGIVTGWEPPVRLVYEEHGWDEGAPPLVTETLIVPAGENACRVRLTHSLYTAEDRWDASLESMERGWQGYLDLLRFYLSRHAGEPAGTLRWMGPLPGTKAAGWQTLLAALDLAGNTAAAAANLGSPAKLTAEPLSLVGTVARVHQDEHSQELLLHLSEPGPGALIAGVFTWGDVHQAAVSLHLYGAAAPAIAQQLEPAWQSWFQQLFPSGE